ncbi:hypothetical protein CA13_53970 [Planctomycetes bacterium CA13]|uniref:Choloylglycine hydrolase/NAAA C-terminal domain-containing protein n=1 Tax=Novipirellula herctigrandis TaxID=2527986 RepID=A0A5C5ZBJ3_9BACT|nr:hypothetical protein CA13_53970 [Planctomycetes bacterium CA13]
MNRTYQVSHIFVALLTIGSIVSNGGGISAHACTVMRFSVDGQLFVARNHDWPFGDGLMVVNQRGIEKKGISAVQPAIWTSKYGSVSFVQFGREIPFAGMNEVGLTVDLLQLHEASFPTPKRAGRSVNVIQWVQYQLDTAKSVEEVIKSLDRVYPMPLLPTVERVHYFVTDEKGGVAVIEFINGVPVVQTGSNVSQCALANSTLKDSRRAFANRWWESSSEKRYLRAVSAIDKAGSNGTDQTQVDYAFHSLESVAQGNLTQWAIVYQPQQRRIEFKTQRASNRRWIDLDDLAFEPTEPTLILDIDTDLSGDLKSHLVPYSRKANERLVHAAFDRYMSPGFARIAVKQLVLNYPDTIKPAVLRKD